MPPIVFEIIDLIANLIRLIGMILFGFGFGLFALEVLRKGLQHWTVQVAVFLGFAGLMIALANFTGSGSVGGFAIGSGAAFLINLNQFSKKKDAESEEKA